MDLTLLMIIAGGALGIWGSIQDQEANKKNTECPHAQHEASSKSVLAVSSIKNKALPTTSEEPKKLSGLISKNSI